MAKIIDIADDEDVEIVYLRTSRQRKSLNLSCHTIHKASVPRENIVFKPIPPVEKKWCFQSEKHRNSGRSHPPLAGNFSHLLFNFEH